MVSSVKIDIPSRATQAEIDALPTAGMADIPAGTSIFNTTTGLQNRTLAGGASPLWISDGLQSAYNAGPDINLSENVRARVISFEVSSTNSIAISAGGAGYSDGDILTVTGGTFTDEVQILVLSTSVGAITGAQIIYEGTYTVIPSNPASVAGGAGAGATFNLSFQFKNFQNTNKLTSFTGGISLGQSGFIPSYAIANFGSSLVGDERAILFGSLTDEVETRLLNKSPLDSVLWYNSDLKRFRTSISAVAKTILIDDDIPTTTKGDAIVHNGITNIRLPVGVDGLVLTADSSTASGVSYRLPSGLFSQTSSITVANTTVLSTVTTSGVGSLTVPANSFVVGSAYTAKLGGTMTTQGAGNSLTFDVSSGVVSIINTGPIALGNVGAAAGWELELDFIVRTIGAVTVATIITNGNFLHSNNNTETFNTINSTTFDTTIDNSLDIKVQWSTIGASNAITTDFLTLFKTY